MLYQENTFVLDMAAIGGLSDEQLLRLCEANSELRMERSKDGELIIMAPTGGEAGWRNSSVSGNLFVWNAQSKLGISFDSSTGYRLPDTSVLSPDASWVAQHRWDALSTVQRRGFIPLCPDFVVEVRSYSDNLKLLLQKMDNWMANGTRLAWLIDPLEQQAHVYMAANNKVLLSGQNIVLSGEEVLPGFELALAPLFV